MYYFYKFGSTILPTARPTDDLSTGQAVAPTIQLPGGGNFDPTGFETAPRGPLTLSISRVVFNQAEFEHLRSFRGQRQKLWRKWNNGREDWTWARCLGVFATRTSEHRNLIEIDISFEILSPNWYGANQISQGGSFSGGTATITATNQGNCYINNALILITVPATATATTSLTITKTDQTELLYTNTLAATDNLILDCGIRSIHKNGADDYLNFNLGSSHRLADWLRIEEGSNTIQITFDGSDLDIYLNYYDGWI